MRKIIILGFVLMVMPAARVAQGQILTGKITGTVTDPTAAVIPGANASAVDLATSHEYKATTDNNGEFVIEQLPYGFFE